MRIHLIIAAVVLVASGLGSLWADEPLFSGPQVGERLPSFIVKGVFDDDAGKELDFVNAAKGKPIVLIFVHDLNRPSVGMTRALAAYTHSRAKDGLVTGVVWLDDDATAAENSLKRIKHALAPGAPIGISLDGREGPGSYGLNRNVTLTILVGKAGKVTANFALVQPSLQADLPKILEQVVAVAGGKVPKLEDIPGVVPMGDKKATRPAAPATAAPAQDPNLRGLLTPVIQKSATPEEVDKAAKALEEYVAKNEATKKEVGRIANTIIDAGKLENYGTPKAQEYLKKWAKEYGKPAEKSDKPAEKPDKASDKKEDRPQTTEEKK